MQKALVAGGAGFLGSHLCESLLQENYKVICIDNLITGNKSNIAPFLSNPNFESIEKDIINPIEKIEVDFIFHLASPASPNKKSPLSYMSHPIETLLVNSLGTYNLLKLAEKNKAKFLYTSSSEVYGDAEVTPQNENYFGNVNPNGIRSVYDEGKRFGEAMTMGFVRKFGTDCRIIRLFNTYGPKMQKDDGRVVSNFINFAINDEPLTVYGKGNQTRSFCFVSDTISGIKKAMFEEKTTGEVFNIGNPDERTIKELAEIIKKLVDSNSEIQYEELPEDDPKIRRPDISKAQRFLDWSPKVRFEEGLNETIKYFRNLNK